MKRVALLAAVLGAGACDERPAPVSPEAPEVRTGLHIPLATGWRATPVVNGITAGPPGRPVLLLEDGTTRPFPDPTVLEHAVVAEGAKLLQKESLESFVGLRYSIEGKEAFVGVRQAGTTAIWCSSLPGAKPDEVEAGLTVCRSIALAPDASR